MLLNSYCYDTHICNKTIFYLTEKIQEHKKNVDRKTYSVKELAEVLGVSENKARQLTHAKDFPVLIIGAKRLTIMSRLDQWLEENIGLIV